MREAEQTEKKGKGGKRRQNCHTVGANSLIISARHCIIATRLHYYLRSVGANSRSIPRVCCGGGTRGSAPART
eukprot:3496604-Rhodomonas_salina.3